MIELELRNCLSPLIAGWYGPEQIEYLHADNDNFVDKAVVALPGGAARVMVFRNPHGDNQPFDADREWPVILNVIVFDENFRGGGRIAVVEHSPYDADFSVPDALLITPGPGGGPRVAKFDFATGDRFDFFAPFGIDYRGGLWASSGDVDGDLKPEALLIGGPRLVAVDMQTFETETSIHVGDNARFEPTGGTIWKGPDLFFWIQFGETVDNRAESKLIPV